MKQKETHFTFKFPLKKTKMKIEKKNDNEKSLPVGWIQKIN
jgi:hypothetical protein